MVILLISINLCLISCGPHKIYVNNGMGSYSQIELCKKDHSFAQFIIGMVGPDTIYGTWHKKNKIIYITYEKEKLFNLNNTPYDSTAQIKMSYSRDSSLTFNIKGPENDFQQFEIILNDSIKCLTDTTGFIKCPFYLPITKIKVSHNLPPYETSFKVSQKANNFDIILSNPASNIDVYGKDFLHVNPSRYFIIRPFKLCEKDSINMELKCFYKRKWRSSIKLLDCH